MSDPGHWGQLAGPCTRRDHEWRQRLSPGVFRSVVLDPRPWPAAGLMIGECPRCRSTLAVPEDVRRG